MGTAPQLLRPSFRQALWFWLKLGCISFGGPSGQIAIMHTELVERRRWLAEERFLHALNFCMLLPGPEAQQLATYIGWWLHGTKGGLVAGVLFVLPSVFILLALSWLYAAQGNVPWVAAFGGAYAVLPYVAQASVEQYGWLSTTQMIDGLGLAETTPGPLIMVLQFVGFMGGWQQAPPGMPRALAAVIGGLLTTWVTFTPCFLWILLGAPFVERLYGNPKLNAALSAVTAAVVGVILNLAIWFAVQTLWPGRQRIEWLALLVATTALVGMWRWRWGVVPVVLGSGALGLVLHLARW